ncbi:MAG: ferritin-like domain-containing protein [Nitrososphaeraceae archaeon]
MKPDFSTLEKEQKLYSLLKSQHEAELIEMNHYMTILSRVSNSLIRNYFYTLLNDGLRNIEYLAKMMADVEGATSSSLLTKEGLSKSIEEEKNSKEMLLRCFEMADDFDIKSILKSIIVDEEHHVKILEHVSELVAFNSANT